MLTRWRSPDKVEAMPDTGAWTLVINEDVRQKLGLSIKSEALSTLADGKTSNYPITEGVTILYASDVQLYSV